MEKDNQKNVVNNFEAGSNCQVFNGNIRGCVFAMPGATVNQHVPEPQTPDAPQDDEQPDVATLATCVDSVRQYFWGDSALAVIFCTCRDCYGYANNMRQFERDFHCQEGLLSNTFRNNPYMRLHVDKWAQQGAKQRVLQLMEAYKNAVEDRRTA
ncbi:hypothetical protein L6466_08455 [Prevotella communis]|jgi:hypothetical protein|uniref:hypothetical protein n=1 Tax=Prevotella communis TaxID=2913614 RepID=UPI001EDA9A80|nr:hypothetical protein [Prevotella communis]UKK68490.1 hypothetical protein L6464_04025 [Prevotella communis]UKK69375.1 hypothetical protein L6466_08455 [Prevotella communis]